jgi:MFS family permease
MRKEPYKKTLIIIMIAQIFGGAGLAAGITVGALLAQDMLGTDSFSGVPVALFTLGSAGAALFVGRLSQRYGRRTGLSIGFLIIVAFSSYPALSIGGGIISLILIPAMIWYLMGNRQTGKTKKQAK